MIINNYQNAQKENHKEKWKWMASELYNTIKSKSDDLEKQLLAEKELGYDYLDIGETMKKLTVLFT